MNGVATMQQVKFDGGPVRGRRVVRGGLFGGGGIGAIYSTDLVGEGSQREGEGGNVYEGVYGSGWSGREMVRMGSSPWKITRYV